MSDTEVYRLPPPSPWERTTLDPAVENATREAAAARLDAAIARRQADAVARDAAQAQREREQAERELEASMDSAREGFRRSGGSEAEWREAHGDIRRRRLTELALQGDPRERAIEKAMAELRAAGSDIP